jgi:hypothetical protein
VKSLLQCRAYRLAGGLLLPVLLAGCSRSLTIRQDPYINTAAQANRPADKRTGEPLEIDIVVVYPADLKKAGNELLRPDSKITCKDWYDRRPQTGVPPAGNRFDLPRDQVYVLTNDDSAFGRHIGSALRGATLDGDKPIKKGGIALGWGMVHNEQTVIYVFPKFIGRDGVLPVMPARFCPPGAYESGLEVKLGVYPNRPLDEAQHIEVTSPRKLYKKESS